jgi:hypothetical protein
MQEQVHQSGHMYNGQGCQSAHPLLCAMCARVVIWVGCFLMTLGYGGMWAQAAGLITPSLGRLLTCAVLAGKCGM